MDSTHQPGHRDRPRAGREVEAGFERLLKDAMTRRERAAAGSECIDVESLAAWSEGALPPSERSIVEAHAARCARCQDMLATMARTAPVEAARGPWNLRHWVMMLAPAAAATAAVVLWFALEPRRQASDARAQRVAVGTEVDKVTSPQAKSAPVAPVQAPAESRSDRAASARPPSAQDSGARAQMAEAKDTDRFLRKDGQAAKPAADSSLARSREELGATLEQERRRKLGAAAGRSADYTLADEKTGSKPAPKASVPAAAPSNVAAEMPAPIARPAAPASPPAGAVSVPSASPPVQTQTAQTQQAADLQQSARQVQGFGGDAGRGGGTLNRAGLNESVVVATLAIAPADASVLWRVVSERIVQQSADKGATWATQYTLDENARLAAGSAPSSTTAWFVGRAGLVLTTTDGRTWRRVAFPEAVDLVGVLATDTRVAIVTTADRRTFTTTDGGASWLARKN